MFNRTIRYLTVASLITIEFSPVYAEQPFSFKKPGGKTTIRPTPVNLGAERASMETSLPDNGRLSKEKSQNVDWVSMGGVPGVDGDVKDLVIDSAGNLYVGGNFTTAGNVVANSVAKWNGHDWSALGNENSFEFEYIYDLTIDNAGNLYACGYYNLPDDGKDEINVAAKWDGHAWSVLGRMNGDVNAIIADVRGNVYAGGRFDTVDGSAARGIARWNGNAWSAPGGGVRGNVFSLVIDDSGSLYAAGCFDTAGGILAKNIAKWNGNAWNALGNGLTMVSKEDNDAYIYLALDGKGDLYAGLYLFSGIDSAAKSIVKWDGNAWNPCGQVPFNRVDAIAFDTSGNLYAAGNSGKGILAKWDGNAWSIMDSLVNDIFTLAFDKSGNLYIGGVFSMAGGVPVKNIAEKKGNSWNALGKGTNGEINAFVVDNSGSVYAAGNFTSIEGTSANHIARWNGSAWNALGNGTNGGISHLTVDGSGNVYAIGDFDTAGGIKATIAKWDGNKWSAVGDSTNISASAIIADAGGCVYAEGHFEKDRAALWIGVAKWNGNEWRHLGEVTYIYTLTIDSSGNLYAGGDFTKIGETEVRYLAAWNGTEWKTIGDGIDNRIHSIVTDNKGNLSVGGDFSNHHLGRWNGHSWSILGSSSPIKALAMDNNGNLYAGGGYGYGNNRIEKWNDSVCTYLGDGENGMIYALAIDHSNNLFAGGSFTQVDGKVSAYLAKCKLPDAAIRPREIGNSPQKSITFDPGSGILHFHLHAATDCRYCVVTLTGRLVLSSSKFLSKGNNSLRINGSVLAPGAYIVQARAAGESVLFRMLVEN